MDRTAVWPWNLEEEAEWKADLEKQDDDILEELIETAAENGIADRAMCWSRRGKKNRRGMALPKISGHDVSGGIVFRYRTAATPMLSVDQRGLIWAWQAVFYGQRPPASAPHNSSSFRIEPRPIGSPRSLVSAQLLTFNGRRKSRGATFPHGERTNRASSSFHK